MPMTSYNTEPGLLEQLLAQRASEALQPRMGMNTMDGYESMYAGDALSPYIGAPNYGNGVIASPELPYAESIAPVIEPAYQLPTPVAPVPAMDNIVPQQQVAAPSPVIAPPPAIAPSPAGAAIDSLIAPNTAAPGTMTPTVAPVAVTAADTGFSDAQRYQRAMARNRAEQSLIQRGLNPADFMPQINQQLDNISNAFTPTTDPTGAFSDNIGDIVYNSETTRRRNEFTNEADNRFGSNYGQKAIGSTLLDDTINEILGTQRGEANQYLDRGKARGMFNEVGESAGRNAIATAEGAARSRLNSTGQDIIQKYRGQADAVRDRAYGAASGFTLGRNFSLEPYVAEAQEVRNRAATMGGGELRNTIGNTNFFDLQGVTNRAGAAQGAINLLDTDVATALNERKRLGGMGRGLGSQGAF